MKGQRVFNDIPNTAFYRIVQQYAFYRGRPVFTIQQQQTALWNYTYFAVTRN